VTTQQQTARLNADVLSHMLWVGVGEVLVPSVVGGLVWWLAAGYTVLALQWIASAFVTVSGGVFWWYTAPLLFSGIEITLWKLSSQMTPHVRRLALGMAGLDLITTVIGLFLAIERVYVPRLNESVHIAISATWVNIAAAGIAVAAAWWTTFSPERYLLNATLQAVEIGKVFWLANKKGRRP